MIEVKTTEPKTERKSERDYTSGKMRILFQKEAEYLGYRVNAKGIHMPEGMCRRFLIGQFQRQSRS